MYANFELLLLSHIIHISPSTQNPFSTRNTMSASTQHSLPASSRFPIDGSIQRIGPNKDTPDIVIHPRASTRCPIPGRRREGKIQTSIQNAAWTSLAFEEYTDLDGLVKDLGKTYHNKLQGGPTAWFEEAGNTVKGYCDVFSPELSVFVCYNKRDYDQVKKDNPHLVDRRTAKRDEARQEVSETPTVSEPDIAEDASRGDYHPHCGRQIDSENRGTCTASDREGDGSSDVEEGEDSIKTKRTLSGTRIERIRARKFGA
jgi:hypothetical protein